MTQYVGTGRPVTHQNVAFGTAAGTITNVVGSQTYRVRVAATASAFISIGNSPTATTSDTYLPANAPEYFTITPGQKVSAIRVAGDGTLHVTEVA